MIRNHQTNRGMAYNGIDVSHWNGPTPTQLPDWCRFFGFKAADVGSPSMPTGVDPRFQTNRELAARSPHVRWTAMYLYVRADVPFVDQVYKLADTVGELSPGECVEIDWEHAGSSLSYEGMVYLNALYPGRVMMYVNDLNAEMTAWMEANKAWGDYGHPLHHPDYRGSVLGLQAAIKWDATIWQQGGGDVPGYARPIDVNLVMNQKRMDRVCGL